MRRNNRMRIFNRKTPLRFALEHITFRCVPRRSKTTARALWLTARSLSYLLGDPYHLHIAPRQEGLREAARHPGALAARSGGGWGRPGAAPNDSGAHQKSPGQE